MQKAGGLFPHYCVNVSRGHDRTELVMLMGNEAEANWWRHWRLRHRDSASVCMSWARVKSNVMLWFLVYKSRIHALFAEIRCTDRRIIWGKSRRWTYAGS